MGQREVFAVVMAGGKGERFWPQSRVNHPKQLLRLLGNLTMIEQAVGRLLPIVPPENCLIITNQEYVMPMRSLLPNIPAENIVGEPFGLDTAPCVALGCGMIKKLAKSADPKIIITPADHVIANTAAFVRTMNDAVTIAESERKIVTIGINPNNPSTGYGYVECGSAVDSALSSKFFQGIKFLEKPDSETAEKLVADGSFKWNSGIFVFALSVFEDNSKKYAPELNVLLNNFAEGMAEDNFDEVIQDQYQKSNKISIDYALMEKLPAFIVIECPFDWDDVGSWVALRNQIKADKNNNVVRGLVHSLDSKDCIVVSSDNHLVALVDVEDLVVVHTDDVTLVCNANSAQRVKDVVRQIGADEDLKKFL